MRRNFHFYLLLVGLLLGNGCSYLEEKMAERHPATHSYNPADGMVPDETTATKVADIILRRAYGDDVISRELPLRATLRSDDVWVVRGTLQGGSDVRGGVAVVEIAKKDAHIVRLSHGQ